MYFSPKFSESLTSVLSRSNKYPWCSSGSLSTSSLRLVSLRLSPGLCGYVEHSHQRPAVTKSCVNYSSAHRNAILPCVCAKNLSPGNVIQSTHAPPTSVRVKHFNTDGTGKLGRAISAIVTASAVLGVVKIMGERKHGLVGPNLVTFDDLYSSRDLKGE